MKESFCQNYLFLGLEIVLFSSKQKKQKRIYFWGKNTQKAKNHTKNKAIKIPKYVTSCKGLKGYFTNLFRKQKNHQPAYKRSLNTKILLIWKKCVKKNKI